MRLLVSEKAGGRAELPSEAPVRFELAAASERCSPPGSDKRSEGLSGSRAIEVAPTA